MGARALKVGRAAVAVACAVACGPARPAARTPAAPAAAEGAAPERPAPPAAEPADFAPAAALDLAPAEGEILVRADVLRAHPVGALAGPAFWLWPGWRGTLRALVADPVADLDWIDVVGPTDAGAERMLARTRSATTDAAIDGRLVAAQARSAEPATDHVAAGIPAAAARLDGVLRVAFRPQAGLVAVVPVARGPAVSRRLVSAHVEAPPAEPLEVLRADLPSPHDVLPLVPSAIRRVRASILAQPNGDADAKFVGACESAEDAARAASELEGTIARQNAPFVRALTRGLLDAVSVTAEGADVAMRLHATRAQLDSLLTVVATLASAAGLSNDGVP